MSGARSFPSTAEEAFVATGNPAFSEDEMRYAQSTQMEPRHWGMVELNPVTKKPEMKFVSRPDPDLIQVCDDPADVVRIITKAHSLDAAERNYSDMT